jgi:hypothetical protein
MKFNPTFLLPAVLLTYSLAVQAEAPAFSNADQDKDGVLSVEEARSALPDLQFRDENGDGLVNHAEAESSIEGLSLPGQPDAQDKSVATIGMAEYRLIVQVIESDSTDA